MKVNTILLYTLKYSQPVQSMYGLLLTVRRKENPNNQDSYFDEKRSCKKSTLKKMVTVVNMCVIVAPEERLCLTQEISFLLLLYIWYVLPNVLFSCVVLCVCVYIYIYVRLSRWSRSCLFMYIIMYVYT